MVEWRDYKQTAIKAGVIAGATLATYLGFGVLEDLAASKSAINNSSDLAQSFFTMLVPYSMASKNMRGRRDKGVIRYATQILPMLFLPEVFQDLSFIMPDSISGDYLNALGKNSNYVSLAGASVPFLGDAKRALREGY